VCHSYSDLNFGITFFGTQCSLSQKSSPFLIFCDIFTCGEPVLLKIILVIVQTYSYVYTNFGLFIVIF